LKGELEEKAVPPLAAQPLDEPDVAAMVPPVDNHHEYLLARADGILVNDQFLPYSARTPLDGRLGSLPRFRTARSRPELMRERRE
jgi:hypothetical protein